MKNKLGIKIGHLVEFTGRPISKMCNNRLRGRVTGFHKSGRAFVETKKGNKWMLPLQYLTLICEAAGGHKCK